MMADDLMDFSEAENQENSLVAEQDENEILKAPGLVQSPVIVNSILKQSTKDNLIQLYTPVQKPEKGRLKVHFGHDSLLQTPNVKPVKKKLDEVKPIKEESEHVNSVPNEGKLAEEDKENRSQEPQNTTELKKADGEAKDGEVAQHTDNKTVDQKVVSDEIDSGQSNADSGLDMSAMEVSVCETETSAKDVDPAFDIILQAEMLLKSLQDGLADIHKPEPVQSSEKSKPTDEKVELNGSEKTTMEEVANNENKDSDLAVANKEHDSQVNGAGCNTEEPMDCEEAMEVDDDDDDEIVFNIGKNKTQEYTAVEVDNGTEQADKTDEGKSVNQDIISEVSNVEIVENVDEKTVDVVGIKGDEIKSNEELSECKNNQSTIEEADKNGEKANNSCEGEHTGTSEIAVESEDASEKNATDDIDRETEPPTDKLSDSKKAGGDSSDEEFMSADEDMDADVRQTSAEEAADSEKQDETNTEPKQDSPERTPPKVGYNLNFDDLDSLDPFATKKSLVNSPDVGKPMKESMKKDKDDNGSSPRNDSNDLISEKVANKEDKNEHFKSATTSPERSFPSEANANVVSDVSEFDEQCNDKISDDTELSAEPEKLAHKENSYAQCVEKEIDFENVDPFKPKTQIANTPEKVKQDVEALSNAAYEVDAATQSEHQNTGKDLQVELVNHVKAEDAKTPKQTVEEKKDNSLPVTPEKQVVEDKKFEPSPAIPVSKGTYNLDALDLEDIDPFKPSKQMTNSPSVTSGQGNEEEADPFKPKKQIQNSPASGKSCDVREPEEIDPFKPKKQIMNSPVSRNEVFEGEKVNIIEAGKGDNCLDETDPFKPKSQIENSPSEPEEKKTEEEVDPFKPKSQIQNSPASKVKGDNNSSDSNEILEKDDPFKTKSNIQNSPAGKVLDDMQPLDMENFDNIDPFKSKTQLPNSPVDKVAAVKPDLPDLDTVDDPFKPRKQMQNSPLVEAPKSERNETESKKAEIKDPVNKPEGTTDPFADIDPFNSRKQLKMSPPAKSTSKEDPFSDLNPFQTKSKVANTPEKEEQTDMNKGLDELADIDPFKSNCKIANSPALKNIEEDPFVTKSRVGNSPSKQENQFSEEAELPLAQMEELKEATDVLSDIIEVQGVTRRGQEMSQSDKFGDIDDTQFVPASHVFNDPAAWEMLEKLGSASSSTAESALSRMSLYVKFDPLVDAAPANPRRISIRVSQLEKVKEYGLDETLLLLDTPPKKRRQSLSASQARATPSGTKSASSVVAPQADKKVEPCITPGAVDLILAYSPEEKEQQEKNGAMEHAPVMALLDGGDAADGTDNLFQELKYTDADLKRIQKDYKLAMQGMLINKDKEWCKKEKQWEQKYAELSKKNQLIKEDRAKLEQAFLALEQTVYEIAAKRDSTEEKNKELMKKNEQALEDIQSVEKAFSDLHRRYEKVKEVTISMQKNEEVLKKYAADCQKKLEQTNEKFASFEKSAQEKEASYKQTVEKLEKQRDSVQNKFDAQIKIMQMKIENMEKTIQRKTEENKQLTEICDNLLANVEN